MKSRLDLKLNIPGKYENNVVRVWSELGGAVVGDRRILVCSAQAM